MWVVEDVPELIYCLAISPRLIGNHALNRSQRKSEKCVSLLRSNADRIAWERKSSRNRITVAASVRLCAGGKFCSSKSCATLMVSTIMRSELMRGTQGFWRSRYVRIAEPYYMLGDLAPADGPGQVALRAWPGLAARHMLLDVIGCVLTNRCPVDLLLLTADEGRADDCSPNCCRPKAD